MTTPVRDLNPQPTIHRDHEAVVQPPGDVAPRRLALGVIIDALGGGFTPLAAGADIDAQRANAFMFVNAGLTYSGAKPTFGANAYFLLVVADGVEVIQYAKEVNRADGNREAFRVHDGTIWGSWTDVAAAHRQLVRLYDVASFTPDATPTPSATQVRIRTPTASTRSFQFNRALVSVAIDGVTVTVGVGHTLLWSNGVFGQVLSIDPDTHTYVCTQNRNTGGQTSFLVGTEYGLRVWTGEIVHGALIQHGTASLDIFTPLGSTRAVFIGRDEHGSVKDLTHALIQKFMLNAIKPTRSADDYGKFIKIKDGNYDELEIVDAPGGGGGSGLTQSQVDARVAALVADWADEGDENPAGKYVSRLTSASNIDTVLEHGIHEGYGVPQGTGVPSWLHAGTAWLLFNIDVPNGLIQVVLELNHAHGNREAIRSYNTTTRTFSSWIDVSSAQDDLGNLVSDLTQAQKEAIATKLGLQLHQGVSNFARSGNLDQIDPYKRVLLSGESVRGALLGTFIGQSATPTLNSHYSSADGTSITIFDSTKDWTQYNNTPMWVVEGSHRGPHLYYGTVRVTRPLINTYTITRGEDHDAQQAAPPAGSRGATIRFYEAESLPGETSTGTAGTPGAGKAETLFGPYNTTGAQGLAINQGRVTLTTLDIEMEDNEVVNLYIEASVGGRPSTLFLTPTLAAAANTFSTSQADFFGLPVPMRFTAINDPVAAEYALRAHGAGTKRVFLVAYVTSPSGGTPDYNNISVELVRVTHPAGDGITESGLDSILSGLTRTSVPVQYRRSGTATQNIDRKNVIRLNTDKTVITLEYSATRTGLPADAPSALDILGGLVGEVTWFKFDEKWGRGTIAASSITGIHWQFGPPSNADLIDGHIFDLLLTHRLAVSVLPKWRGITADANGKYPLLTEETEVQVLLGMYVGAVSGGNKRGDFSLHFIRSELGTTEAVRFGDTRNPAGFDDNTWVGVGLTMDAAGLLTVTNKGATARTTIDGVRAR